MNRILKLAVACVAALSLALALVGCTNESYTPPTKTATVDSPTIGVSKTLRVGVNAENTPFAYQLSGRIAGLDVDLAAALADEMGLNLQLIDVGSDPESAIRNGEVDIVMGLNNGETWSCWLSDSYIDTSVAVFAPTSVTAAPDSNASPSIAAQVSSMSAWEVSNQFGDSALVTANSLSAAFQEMTSGSADYVAADAVIGSYVAFNDSIDAHIVALLEEASGYSIGIASTNADLQAAVDSALDAVLGNGMMSVIETKWLGQDLDLSNATVLASATTGQTDGAETESGESEEDGHSSADTSLSVEDVLTPTSEANTGGSGVDSAGSNAVQLEGSDTAE